MALTETMHDVADLHLKLRLRIPVAALRLRKPDLRPMESIGCHTRTAVSKEARFTNVRPRHRAEAAVARSCTPVALATEH